MTKQKLRANGYTDFLYKDIKKVAAEEDWKERDAWDPELSQAGATRQHVNLCNSLDVCAF